MRRSWLRSFWVGLILVGAAVAYVVSSGLGARLLHDEIETQLSRLLQGPVEIAEVQIRLEGGLRLEARGVEAFPSSDPTLPPAVRAQRVVAWIDGLALLIGRLELSTLTLEGPFLRVEQDAEGRFSSLPLPRLALGPIDHEDEMGLEAIVARIEGLDAIAAAFFENLSAADRIEILDGTIHWLRRAPAHEHAPPTEIRLELFSTIIERDWLSNDLRLDWSAVVVDGKHAPFPVGAAIARRGDAPTFDWTISMSQIPLAAAQTPLGFVERIEGLSGQLTTVLHLGNAPDGSRRLRVDGSIHDATIGLRRSKTRIHREQVDLHAEFEIGAKRLELVGGHLQGTHLGLDLKGSIARPIRARSRVRLESRTVGVELEDLFELVDSVAQESEAARSFSTFVENVVSGRILYIEAAGTTSLRRWQDLASGRAKELPDGFLLGGAFENVRVETGPDDRIEGLRGEIEWVEDRITLRDTSATFRGSALPRMNLVLEGASHLARTTESERRITRQPPPIPGLAPLAELLKPRDPTSEPPVKAIGLAVDRLEHPIFRYPIRDLRVLIEPQRGGMDVHVQSGVWGGASVRGELHWSSQGDRPTLAAQLTLGEADAAIPATEKSPESTASGPTNPVDTVATTTPVDPTAPEAIAALPPKAPSGRWGQGRFELEFRPRPTLPFRSASGFFRLNGTRLLGNEVQFAVDPVGQLAARLVLDLADPERVGVDMSLAVTDARLEHISSFIALPPQLATGQIGATGSLKGSIQPDQPLIGKLDGRIRVEARDGKIRTEVPLLLRLSRASEGYNPFSNQNEIRYETLTASIDFRQGSLLAEDFEIEGPLRVYVRGRIDPLANPSQARGVVGIFLFRAPNQILESLPLVKYFLPGSERGLIGAYFKVKGALAEPSVENLPVDTLMTIVPSAIKAPFKVLQYLFDPSAADS